MSSSNSYREQPKLDNIPCYEDYGSMLRFIPSTPHVGSRYYRSSNESALRSSFDESISPSPSIIDAMDELFIEHNQSEIQSAIADQRHDQFIESSSMPSRNIRAHHPADQGFKTSNGNGLIEPFDFVWPKCPAGIKNAPMIAKWEVHRIACHCSVDLEDVLIEYRPAWKDQDIFWEDVERHKNFHGKTFPAKCGREVWVQGHEDDFSTGRAVGYKARLRFDNINKKPKFELEIPVSQKSSRLHRKFGFNRFMELKLLFGDGCKSTLQDKDKKRALARWLVHKHHLFLHYKWAAFFIEDMKPKKEKAGLTTPKMTGKRVVLFAEQGAGLNFSCMAPKTTSHSNNLSAVMSVNPVCDRFSLLDWLLQLDSNLHRPYIKLFHRISLGLSKTTPTILLMEDSIWHRPTDIESPNHKPMNDGIGRISHSLLREVRDIMGLDFLPVAIQARIGGAKGLWMLDSTPFSSDKRWIEIYPSQIKWDCNWSDPAHRTLEIVSVSSYGGPATLNLQFIPILEERAIDRELMRRTIDERIDQHLRKDLDHAKAAMETPELFRKWIRDTSYTTFGDSHDGMSWFIGGLPRDWSGIMSFLADGGFEPRRLEFLNEIMFRHQMSRWRQMEAKLHIEIAQSTSALMTIDFLGVLAPGEVQLCFSPAFDDGKQSLDDLGGLDVLVARSPAHLPSDIQKVKAVFKPELRQFKNVIIFSSLGDESLASKLSGGDYDGDKAWVCWDPDIVNNFESVDMASKVSFEEYFRPNIQNAGILASRYGKPHYLDALLEEAFSFRLSPSFMGICTSYKESLAYDERSIRNETTVRLSMLLSELVDQEKSGFEFDDNVWYRIRKDMCGGKMFLKAPAYKSGDLVALATSNQIIDILKHSMHERIQNGLKKFSTYRLSSGIGPDKPVLTTFDMDLVSYWNDFEKEAEQITSQFEPSSLWLKDFRSSLITNIDECLSYWGDMMSGKEDYLTKAIPVYERWRNISLNVRCNSPVAAIMTSLFNNGIRRSKGLGQWDLLKASLTFKRHHQRTWFVWQMAGRQLQFIKACAVRGAGENDLLIPIPVVSRMYRVLRPDARRIERVIADQDRDFENDP
ncbi:hypothetical protein FPOA_12078 [Fusarium poae]|uniref:RNA-dependent RNA polymerase n=2 Tax=Fusarium poae TaxID=36050 RepID=A0A1B8AAC8_FUSPO|nr:hypothetical protein FPOA_12078 [Fusarium poae]